MAQAHHAWGLCLALEVRVVLVLGVLVALAVVLDVADLLAYHPPTFKYENIDINKRPAIRETAERICKHFVINEYIPPGLLS